MMIISIAWRARASGASARWFWLFKVNKEQMLMSVDSNLLVLNCVMVSSNPLQKKETHRRENERENKWV